MCSHCGCAANNKHRLHLPHRGSEDGAIASVHGLAHEEGVIRNILAANDRIASHNRQHFDESGLLAINLMSSPGSGKTSLLEATIDALGPELGFAVIEGDLETENDAARIRAKGVPALQITTGGACHLDATMVHHGLHELDLNGVDVLFIENVGNLVCPASFDLGAHCNVTLLSATEGDDKPAKYPIIFRKSDLVMLTKSDLLPYLDNFQVDRAAATLKASGYDGPLLRTSAAKSADVGEWLAWLRQRLADHRAGLFLNPTTSVEAGEA
ncbi:hydrogenase nickel incorporation protein HypB [Bradyrhizobium sp. CCH5-F6]|jgi:hydrogenase nickel incorporation protein HypB|uniref:hydrogenase nickel incorporation protein HypB n=1 Tax=Bradyrhizobium sp. CCH5-F6 TaxID=1768753 RepID=UPI0009E84398|nr:hydrogenase nickel incorporation protein HypB [Bradyrhizobium sp. CCH5-F6]